MAVSEETQRHRERRSWPWLVAAFLFCPCHIPILLAILGTGALGGALAHNEGVLFVALAAAFAFALWRYVRDSSAETCPECDEDRRAGLRVTANRGR